MRDILKDAYEECNVGDTKTVGPDQSAGESIDSFQSVRMAAEYMQEKGLIHVKNMHRESQSGNSLIDLVTFVRLK
jgi:hypothetical protein